MILLKLYKKITIGYRLRIHTHILKMFKKMPVIKSGVYFRIYDLLIPLEIELELWKIIGFFYLLVLKQDGANFSPIISLYYL